MLGAHWVKDSSEISFAFHAMNDDSMLFNDVGAKNVSELEINKELKI